MKVTVGIPVYNGAASLARALDSVVNQTFRDVEIVLSDNGSTDGTEVIARAYAARDSRIRYIRQPTNIGARKNFEYVLEAATGELFAWLGHDDWFDGTYLARCVEVLDRDPGVALACGVSRYYRDGAPSHPGRIVEARQGSPLIRALTYLAKVTDNGTFYGLMRRSQLQAIEFQHALGGDWLLLATVALTGKLVTIPDVAVHRDLGGATRSYAHIVRSLELPAWNARLPKLAIATAAYRYFADPRVTGALPATTRRLLPMGALLTIGSEPVRRTLLAPARAVLRATRPSRRALAARLRSYRR